MVLDLFIEILPQHVERLEIRVQERVVLLLLKGMLLLLGRVRSFELLLLLRLVAAIIRVREAMLIIEVALIEGLLHRKLVVLSLNSSEG